MNTHTGLQQAITEQRHQPVKEVAIRAEVLQFVKWGKLNGGMKVWHQPPWGPLLFL